MKSYRANLKTKRTAGTSRGVKLAATPGAHPAMALGSKRMPSLLDLVDSADPALFSMQSKAPGPQGQLPITAEMLLNSPSGNMFAWGQNATWVGTPPK